MTLDICDGEPGTYVMANRDALIEALIALGDDTLIACFIHFKCKTERKLDTIKRTLKADLVQIEKCAFY